MNNSELLNNQDKVIIKRKYIIVLVTFFILYCLFLSWSFLFQNVDDAYISFRYGKNMMNGNGLVYNRGEYLEGYTNFLWTIITAPFTTIKSIDISRFAITLGLIISVFNFFLLIKISRLCGSFFLGMPKYFLLLPAIFFVLDDSVAFWAIGGMEFPLYVLLILGVIYFYFNINENERNYLFLSLFLMLCTLNRPEGNMIFGFLIFHMLLYRKSIKSFNKKISTIIGLYILFAFIYYGLKYLYYGHVIPNTFYAKGVTDMYMNLWLGFKYLVKGLGTRSYLFVFILFIPLKTMIRDFRWSYIIMFSIVYILYLWSVGGDWMIANRFFVPILPFLYILSAIGLSNAIQKFIDRKPARRNYLNKITNRVVIFLCVLIFGITMSLLEYNTMIIKEDSYQNDVRWSNCQYEMQWSMFGKWLKMNVSPKTIIAVGPAGKIPYYSELYTIDMWGLNDAHIAQKRSVRPAAGHKKYDFDYVLSFNPEFIIGYAGFKDEDIPQQYEKFNAPEEKYQSIDVVFRLKPEYRKDN